MRACPTCGEKTQQKWTYCPNCGTGLDRGVGEYNPDRLKYLLGQDSEGHFIHKNFTSVRHAGTRQWREVRDIREKLGDFSHLYLNNLQVFSLIAQQPRCALDLYQMGKLVGRGTIGVAMKVIGTEKLINSMIRTGLFWKIFRMKSIQKNFFDGWKNAKVGMLKVKTVDKNQQLVVFSLNEGPCAPVKGSNSVDFLSTGILAGQADGLFSGNWEATETKCECAGDGECVIEVRLFGEQERDNPVEITKLIDSRESERILDALAEDTVNQKPVKRRELGDYKHISMDQTINYFFIATSPGYAILTKHAGVLVGERIAEKAKVSGEGVAFSYARDLFLYLKAGILHEPEEKGDRLTIRMDESVYANGVKNIHVKLDVFLAGIIEGLLKKSTGGKWLVEETKCLANGNEYCEFRCKRQS